MGKPPHCELKGKQSEKRSPVCEKMGLKGKQISKKKTPGVEDTALRKGPWRPDEDAKLVEHIQKHGHKSWPDLPQEAGLLRCGKSCRLRWTNYLSPDIKRESMTLEEELAIIHLHNIFGNKWSAIASHLPGRTDNVIKNSWNNKLAKQLEKMGIDPATHTARPENLNLENPPVVSQMSEWDCVLSEMEARFSTTSTSSAAPPQVPFPFTARAFLSSPDLLSPDLPSPDLPVSSDSFNYDYSAFLDQDWSRVDPTSLDYSKISTPSESQINAEYVSPMPQFLVESTSSVASSSRRFDGFPMFPILHLRPDLPKPTPALLSTIINELSPTSTLSNPFGTTTLSEVLLPPTPCDDSLYFAPPDQQLIPDPEFWTTQYPNSSMVTSAAPAIFATAMSTVRFAPPEDLQSLTEDIDHLQLHDAAAELGLMDHQLNPDSPVAAPTVMASASMTAMSGSVSSAASLGWPSTSQNYASESQDYWATMLHLVGPPPAVHRKRRQRPHQISK